MILKKNLKKKKKPKYCVYYFVNQSLTSHNPFNFKPKDLLQLFLKSKKIWLFKRKR